MHSAPAFRRLRHPGPVDPMRIESAVDAEALAVRLALPAGRTLLDGVTDALATLGVTSGTMSLVGGRVSELAYVLAGPDPSGERQVALSDPIEHRDATLVTGAGTIGLDSEGRPLVHCHALFGGTGEAHGGHLLVDRTVMGEGVVAHVRTLRGGAIAVRHDDEINAPIFRPAERAASSASEARSAMNGIVPGIERGRTGRIAFLRIRPNEDLVGAVQEAAERHGFAHAFVRGSLGSLTDACLAAADGTIREVAGHAVEVLTILGEVRPGPDGTGEARLSGTVADPQGRVFGGRFVPGRNPICMTFELVLEEWLPEGAEATA